MKVDAEAWSSYIESIAAGLRGMLVTDRRGLAIPPPEGFARWVAMTRTLHEGSGQLFIIGNGGSAGMASHMAADACKNGHLRAMALNDVALLTATANDLAYDQVFSLPLERLARAGDLVIAISSSGNSPNILRAVEAARSIPAEIVTLTGKGADNRARTCGDLNFYVPSPRYGWVECAHQLILHYWLDQYLNLYGEGAL
jgi:D-sedoheptulose 7-phosphate isomerase